MKTKVNIILRTACVFALFCFVLPVSFGQTQKKEKVHSSIVVDATKIVKGIVKPGEIKGTKFPEGLAKSSTSTQRTGVNMTRRASISSLDALVGPAIMQSVSSLANVEKGGNSIDITKYNSTTLQIEHFSSTATNKIKVNVNLSDGTFSIPAGQILWTWSDGIPVYLRAIIDGYIYPDSTINGYIDGSGNLQCTTGWADIYTEDGSNYYNDGVWASSSTVRANGKMKVNFYQNSSPALSYNVLITQSSSLETISVLNFGDYGQEIKINVNNDKTVTIPCQLGLDVNDMDEYWSDGSPQYDYYTVSTDWSNNNVVDYDIMGTISTASIDFGNWTMWDINGGKYVTGKYNDGKITLNSGSFRFPGDGNEVIATSSSNAALIAVARKQGWISSTATQMTQSQAEAVTDIGDVFKGNKDLTSFEEFQYFTSVTELKTSAFEDCSNLNKIILPNSIKSLGSFAFEWTKLSTINIPSSVTTISDYCFSFASSLSSITVDSNNSYYSSNNGILYNKDKTTIVRYPEAKSGTSFTIPSTVTNVLNNCFHDTPLTSVTIPSSVTSIAAGFTFSSSSLTTITVNSSNSSYSSDDGVLFNKDKTTIICYPEGKSGTSFTIPSTVKKVEKYCFYYTKLESITIPSSITSIEIDAFYTSGLKTVKAGWVTPPSFSSTSVFSSKTYSEGILNVPAGSSSNYKSTNYWNKFTNIVEDEPETPVTAQIDGISYALTNSNKTATITNVSAQYDDVVVPETVTYNGKSYSVTGIAEQALASDGFNYSVSLPSTITSVDAKAFDNAATTAIIWNSNTELPANAFSSLADTWKNMLLYVNKSGIAPSSFANTIVNGTAQNIVLQEGYVFHCPMEFIAKKILFSHEFTMETLIGKSQGWETIALPFDVETISHASKGFLIPFASYSSSSSNKPFWLYQWSSSGFVKAASMQANVPYLISMPNNAAYSTDYNLVGTVTFSATNCIVKSTTDLRSYGYNNKYFFPSYYFMGTGGSYPNYSINSVNNLHSKDGGYAPGSIFINNSELRNTYPFEGYIEYRSESSAPAVCEIEFAPDNFGTTDIEAIMEAIPSKSKAGGVYTLSGQKITVDDSLPEEEIVRQLPAGIYIVNGKKVVVR